MAEKKKYNHSYNDEDDLQELEQLENEEQNDLISNGNIRKALVIEKDDVFFAVKLIFNNIPQVCRVKQNVIDKYIRNNNLIANNKDQGRKNEFKSNEIKPPEFLDLPWVCADEETTVVNKNVLLKEKFFVLALDIQSPQYKGEELGLVLGEISNHEELKKINQIVDVVRIADNNDINKYNNNLEREKKAYKITKDKIIEHSLDMKLVSVHYFFDNSKIIFNYTAASRVDFRNLVKDLAAIFKMRIEMRQIGVRDECRIMGGYGQCGKHFCCSNVMNSLDAIKISMAKEQNLTLNSLKISGTCGRLLCCLSYEYKTYAKEKADYPTIDSRLIIDETTFFVKDVNIQSKSIKISSKDDERIINIDRDDVEFDKEQNKWIYRGEGLDE